MKILELPVETTVRCKCGCKFEFDTNDITTVSYYADYHEVIDVTVFCPFCKERILLKKVYVDE